MNFKRRKPRRWVRCAMCTDARVGNSKKQDCKKDHEHQTRSERRQVAR